MVNSANYKVFPQKTELKDVSLSEYEQKEIKLNQTEGLIVVITSAFVAIFTGISSAYFFNILAYIFGYYNKSGGTYALIIGIVCAAIAGYLVFNFIRRKKTSALKQKKLDAENQEQVRRAANVAGNLISSLDSSNKLAGEISNCLNEASAWLKTAEAEFRSNAFAPFWDAVEQAAIWLGDYNNKTNQIAAEAERYYRQLNGEKHTFPVFPVRLETIPDASFVASELYRVTRLGQTNFQFANIWEHRRTRQTIGRGFQNLNDAINNLGYTIDNSMSNLQNSISSDVARVVEEQIQTRDSINKTRKSIEKTQETFDQKGEKIDGRLLEQNRMLDNIQHNRNPDFKDVPSKR